MIDQETRELAIKVFRDALTDPNSKPVDKLRAAEGIMKLEAEERDKGLSDMLDASDEELLKRARGEHEKEDKDADLARWLTK